MNIKSKEQHKRVLDNIIEQKANGELVNEGKAIIAAGYSKATAHNPKSVIDTIGFQQLIAKRITDKTLVDYLATDLEIKEGNRVAELKLAFELKGMLTNKLDVTTHQEVDEQLQAMKQVIDKVKNE